jgi:hypothetical protein
VGGVSPSYEVVAQGEAFAVPTFRQMIAFAHSLERHGIAVTRCQIRLGASLLPFKRTAWSALA